MDSMLRAYVREMALIFYTHLNVLISVTLQTLYIRQQLGRMMCCHRIVRT